MSWCTGSNSWKKLFAVISMLWSRLPPILWYYGWELLHELSLLAPLVEASAIEDSVGILYNENNVRQICVCQTRNRENDAAFRARVKALTKYLQVILILEPFPYCFFGGHRGFCNTSQKYFALDGVHLIISCGTPQTNWNICFWVFLLMREFFAWGIHKD